MDAMTISQIVTRIVWLERESAEYQKKSNLWMAVGFYNRAKEYAMKSHLCKKEIRELQSEVYRRELRANCL